MSGVDEIIQDPSIEEVEDDLEPEEPVKRRVVGRRPKQHIKLQYVPSQTRSEPEYIPPQTFYPPPAPPAFNKIERMPTRSDLQRQADQQVEYELMVEMRRQQVMRAQQPRPSTSRKLLNVANRAAGTDRGEVANICQRTNASLTKYNPGVSLYAKKRTTNDLNAVIRNIAPKVAKPQKSSKKKGFWA